MSVDWTALAGYGFSLFAVPRRTKRPAGPWREYQTRRATDAELVQWARGGSNAAIATGAVSGVIVLDVDTEAGAAEVARRCLPRTPTVRTARGRHYYLRHPGGRVANFSRRLDGCDLRGDGGYVIAAGSIHPDGTIYTWEISPAEAPFADPPAWLLDLARDRPEPEPPPRPSGTSAYAEAALDRELAALRRATKGARNETLESSRVQPRHADRRRRPDGGDGREPPARQRAGDRTRRRRGAGNDQQRPGRRHRRAAADPRARQRPAGRHARRPRGTAAAMAPARTGRRPMPAMATAPPSSTSLATVPRRTTSRRWSRSIRSRGTVSTSRPGAGWSTAGSRCMP